MKKVLFIISAIVLIIISIFSCSRCHKTVDLTTSSTHINTPREKQLKISILLDLSDRITVPGIKDNDIENVKTITEFFKKNMADLGAYKAKGKIRIFFSPTPSNSNVNSLVNNLNIDCSGMDNKGRKSVYDGITELYFQNLEGIYQEVLASSDWHGADIWRFFKDDVSDFCIERDTNYRNILIILTDGYLYHQQSVYQNENRYTYLLANNISPYRNMNWKDRIERDNFGILTERNDLSNLEVLVLEVKSKNNKIDEDILKHLWKKWFQEMSISHYEVYQSDLPANTKTRIENFLINSL